MIYPLKEVETQLSKTEHQLMYHLILEQQETNRLLKKLAGETEAAKPTEIEEIEKLKRPELMKRMAKLANKPTGWNKWGTDQIIKHLKGVSA